MPVSVSEVDFSLLVLLIAMAVRPQCCISAPDGIVSCPGNFLGLESCLMNLSRWKGLSLAFVLGSLAGLRGSRGHAGVCLHSSPPPFLCPPLCQC